MTFKMPKIRSKQSKENEESSFSQVSQDTVGDHNTVGAPGATVVDFSPCSSSPQKSPTVGDTVSTNLKRFCGMGNAAVGGLIEFGAKYGRSFDETDLYDEFEDRRFFDSRDYRCCFSIFHAKIGTFIFCTLILHEIVLGTIYLLTQVESSSMSGRIALLMACRLLQLPPMALLYVALWRHQRYLLLPFAFSQLSLGVFTDISSFMILLEHLERSEYFVVFDGDLKWLNLAIPLAIYTMLLLCLMWVLYKCFRFLHARRQHDLQRKLEKQKEREALLLCASPRDVEQQEQPMLPDEVMLVSTRQQHEPKSVSGEGTSVSSEQAAPLHRHQHSSHSARNEPLQNRHSSCQFSYHEHSRTNSADRPMINVALSALVLNRLQNDENGSSTGDVDTRCVTLPPPPHANGGGGASPNARTPTLPLSRKRLTSEQVTKRPAADAEFTSLLLQHRNPRSSHLRGFRGSAYSLQDYLKFHINIEKANSATPTMPTDGGGGSSAERSAPQTRPMSLSADARTGETMPSSCSSSAQSLTLVEPAPPSSSSVTKYIVNDGKIDSEAGSTAPVAINVDSPSANALDSTNTRANERQPNDNSSEAENGENGGEATPISIPSKNPFPLTESHDGDRTPTVNLQEGGPFITAKDNSDETSKL